MYNHNFVSSLIDVAVFIAYALAIATDKTADAFDYDASFKTDAWATSAFTSDEAF